jgi:hypothetical protein
MYRGIAAAGLQLNANQAVVDGEIVALDAQGSPSFQALQHRGSHPGHQIVFYAFDLLLPVVKRRLGDPVSPASSFVFAPASASFRTAMICSSENLFDFIVCSL